jgi:hypothetical protein
MMTLQELIDALSALSPSARTAAVFIRPSDDEQDYLCPVSVVYEHGEVTIQTEVDGV